MVDAHRSRPGEVSNTPANDHIAREALEANAELKREMADSESDANHESSEDIYAMAECEGHRGTDRCGYMEQ